MAITSAFCTQFKSDLLDALIGTSSGKTIKIALYTSSATLGAATTAYSATNETSGTGYVAGGNTLAGQVVATSGTTAYGDFTDSTWSTSTITARGCLIYNSTDANAAISTHDFGSDKSSSGGAFTVQFPTADATNAILRLA